MEAKGFHKATAVSILQPQTACLLDGIELTYLSDSREDFLY